MCFAASYAISTASEIVRVFWPSRFVRYLATAAAVAGIVAHTLFLAARTFPEGKLPIATQFESLITVSWFIVLIYLYLSVRSHRLAAGVFILPISFGMVLFAGLFADRGVPSSATHSAVVAVSHGLLLLLGTVVVVFALVSALMYLVKFRQLKAGALLGAVRLPSLERLDRINTVSVYVAYAFLTVGIILGIAMRRLGLSDPKVTTTLVAWGLFTLLAHYRYRPEKRGRRVAVLTIVACAVVLVSVLGDPLFGTGHQATQEGP
jgi:ABC-type transport system involved in cytochrome c biogenesis permease subunit